MGGDRSRRPELQNLYSSVRFRPAPLRGKQEGRGLPTLSPPFLATRLAVPPPRTDERPAEPQADTDPRPVPKAAIPGVPPTAPRIWMDPADVARRRRHGVGRDVVVEVIAGPVHLLHEVH